MRICHFFTKTKNLAKNCFFCVPSNSLFPRPKKYYFLLRLNQCNLPGSNCEMNPNNNATSPSLYENLYSSIDPILNSCSLLPQITKAHHLAHTASTLISKNVITAASLLLQSSTEFLSLSQQLGTQTSLGSSFLLLANSHAKTAKMLSHIIAKRKTADRKIDQIVQSSTSTTTAAPNPTRLNNLLSIRAAVREGVGNFHVSGEDSLSASQFMDMGTLRASRSQFPHTIPKKRVHQLFTSTPAPSPAPSPAPTPTPITPSNNAIDAMMLLEQELQRLDAVPSLSSPSPSHPFSSSRLDESFFVVPNSNSNSNSNSTPKSKSNTKSNSNPIPPLSPFPSPSPPIPPHSHSQSHSQSQSINNLLQTIKTLSNENHLLLSQVQQQQTSSQKISQFKDEYNKVSLSAVLPPYKPNLN